MMYEVTIKVYFGAGMGKTLTTSVIASSKDEAESVALKQASGMTFDKVFIARKLEVIKCKELWFTK